MHIHISIPSADFLAIVRHTNQKALNAEALPEKVRRHAGSGRIAPLILQLDSRRKCGVSKPVLTPKLKGPWYTFNRMLGRP